MLDSSDCDFSGECTTVTVVQTAPAKAPPKTALDWYKLIGPRVLDLIKPFQCGAPWTGFANDAELLRLAKLQMRIERNQRLTSELKAERGQIMRRCVRRMRRSKGLDL